MDFLPYAEGLSVSAVVATGLSISLGLYLLFTAIVQPALSEKGKFYKSSSWVGLRKELFSHMRAQARTIGGMGPMLDEGYEKFSKAGKAFLVPLFSNEPFLILPPTKMKQISSLPHDQIDAEIMHAESLQVKWTVGEDISGYKAYHMDVVRRQ